MKKILFLLFVIFFNYSAKCSHLMGGEIVVQNDQVGNYEILLTLYRDITGINLPNVQTMEVYDSNGGLVTTIISNLDSTAYHSVYGIQNGSLLPNNCYGTEIFFYKANFPCFTPGNYTVTWNNCCRNPTVVNIPNPGSISMFLKCDFTVDLTTTTSTPFFLSPPIVCVPVNSQWQYNPLPFDSESDSLSWSLGTPFDYVSGSSNLGGSPITGYSLPPSLPGGDLSINPYTGELSWSASVVGNYVYTIICEEFRNGFKLGEIRRDMQFIVLANNNLPSLSNLNTFNTNSNGVPFLESTTNTALNFDLYVIDSSSLFMSFDGLGDLFTDSLNPMTYTIHPTNNIYEKRIALNWTPTNNYVRSNPYIITSRLFNGTFSMDYTFFIYVNDNTSYLSEIDKGFFKIFPNPNSGSFTKNIYVSAPQRVNFLISDLNGQILTERNVLLNEGVNNIIFGRNFKSGIYLLTTEKNGGEVTVEKVVVKN